MKGDRAIILTPFRVGQAEECGNIRKHGISFDVAKAVFAGDLVTWTDERQDYGEVRKISIGLISDRACVTVVYTYRKERLRLISARPASAQERKRYEEALRPTDERG